MKIVERFAELLSCETVASWKDRVISLGNELGYDKTLLAIFPDRNVPMEVDYAFLQSNYPSDWRAKYDNEKMGHYDPVVKHCATKSVPLVWSPELFSETRQKEMYEEACSFGLRSGVTLPIHGVLGELGILCFVTDHCPGQHFQDHVAHTIAELTCFRDFIFESASSLAEFPASNAQLPNITKRELECIKWTVAGKSSWEIGQILNCSEATVNFHFSNIRKKFGAKSKWQVAVKAIYFGLVTLA